MLDKILASDFLFNLTPLVVLGLMAWAYLSARRQPLWAEAFRRIRRNRLALFALAIIGLYGLVALADSFGRTDKASQDRVTLLDSIAGPSIKDHTVRPVERTYSKPFDTMTTGEPKPQKLKAPGSHILGTDGTGQDVFYRTLKGARTAFIIGGLTSVISVPLALALGLLAGYKGKLWDDVIQYVYTVLSSIPSTLLLIVLVLVLGKGLPQICIALGITRWVGLCRLARGETLKHRDREYVRSAKALGVSDAGIMGRHILPNLLPVIIISTTLGFSNLILSEAILAFLGVGVDESVGSWGNMIDAARDELARDPIIWWNLTGASVAMFVLVLAFNLIGDALRDAVDPRLRS